MSNEITKRATTAATKLSVSQLAQIIINVLFFEVACEELEGVLVTLKFVFPLPEFAVLTMGKINGPR